MQSVSDVGVDSVLFRISGFLDRSANVVLLALQTRVWLGIAAAQLVVTGEQLSNAEFFRCGRVLRDEVRMMCPLIIAVPASSSLHVYKF